MNLTYCWGPWPQYQLRNPWSPLYPTWSQGSKITDCASPKLSLVELWMRTETEGEKNRIPCCTHSWHKNEYVLIFPFCTEVNEEEGVHSDCGIGISKLRVIAWFPVLFASAMDAARQFWQLLKDKRETVLVWQLCDDLIVHLFNYVYFLIKQILIKGTDSITLRGSVSAS